MGAQYDEGPELAPQNFPEVAHQPYSGSPHYGYQQPYSAPKPEGYSEGSTYAVTAPTTSPYAAAASPFSQHAMTDHDQSTKRSKGVVCGCSLLVLILSCIIALLSAAVIGLAAGIGVEANRANDATTKLTTLNASIFSPSFNDIDRGCSNDPDGVSGTNYTSFPCRSILYYLRQQTYAYPSCSPR